MCLNSRCRCSIELLGLSEGFAHCSFILTKQIELGEGVKARRMKRNEMEDIICLHLLIIETSVLVITLSLVNISVF